MGNAHHTYDENYWDISDVEWSRVIQSFDMIYGPLTRQNPRRTEYDLGRILDGYGGRGRTIQLSGIKTNLTASIWRWETKR